MTLIATSATAYADMPTSTFDPLPPARTQQVTPENPETFRPHEEQLHQVLEYDRALVARLNQPLPQRMCQDHTVVRGMSVETVRTMNVERPTVRQFLVSLEINSGSSSIGVGHAAIIGPNYHSTLEPYGKGFYSANKNAGGVLRLNISAWTSERGVFCPRPEGPAVSKYRDAGVYANNQFGKPYNWIFVNKWDQSKFYCSQLVWRSWINQGFELTSAVQSKMPFVTPAMLLNGGHTRILQQY